MHLSRLTAALCLATLLATAAMAQAPTAQDLQNVEQELTVSAERQRQLEEQAKAAVAAENELSNRLVALAETAAAHERKRAKAESRQTKLKAEIATINLDLAARQDVIAEVLAGLQRLEHNPPPALVVAPDDVLGALRGAMVFGTIVPELRREAQHLHDQLSDLKALREKLETETRDADQALIALTQSRIDIKTAMAEKQALARQSVEDLAREKQAAEALAMKATSLRDLLAKLADERAKAEAKASAEEKARAEAEARAKELEALPQIAFAKAQGQVPYPAQGQVLRKFGDDSGLGSTLDGIVIATLKDAQVLSPVSGKVEFSGKFRSYGQMVIINPGDNYLILLAGLEEALASLGQTVKVGEPVGRMGQKPGTLGLSNGLTNQSAPVLYVEFRKNGNPVDPAPWWVGSRQEAMR